MTRQDPFFDRLEAVRSEKRSTLCVGIDPRLERMPVELRQAAGDDVEELLVRFGTEVLDLTAPCAACWKPQIAFFEAHGLAGLRAYARVLAEARGSGCLVIGDVKRGDIGSTAKAYAAAFLRPGADLEVDAITVNPYLGRDALQPFVTAAQEHGKGIYVLVKTSNPGSADLQDLPVGGAGTRLHECAADLVAELGAPTLSPDSGLAAVGAVIGATHPEALAAMRARLPATPFLVPGYGAQGATAADVAAAYRADGSGAVINASRSVTYPAAAEGGWREAVANAARAAQEELHAAGSPA